MDIYAEIESFVSNFPSKSTRRAYESDILEFLPYCEHSLQSVTLQKLINYRDLLANKLSPNSVNRKLSSIKGLFSWLHTRNLITNNPTSSLQLLKARVEKPTQAFSDEEVRLILKNQLEDSGTAIRNKLVLSLLFSLGLRRSEVCNIKLKDIYESRGFTILKVLGKGSKSREVPLNSELLGLISRYCTNQQKQPEEHLVKLSDSAIYKLVVSAAKKAGITKRVSPHSCRATVISHLLEKGESPRNVANLAGHASISTTVDIYDKKRDNIKNSSAFRINYES